MEKDLRLQAQHCDFQAQLSAEQTAHEQVTNTLELMRQELEELDVSLTDNANLNHERNKAEQEKCKLVEELEKTKIEYKQALASKSREVRNRANKINIWKKKCGRKERRLLKQANISFNP